MIEGVTTIELTDVNTGEKEKIESKNMVTNAVRDIIKNPVYFDRYNLKRLMPYYYTFYGGLVCFDTSLQENADNYYPPFSADTIACGAIDLKNTSEDQIRGSYNATESELNETEGYMKFVYDFTTLQGNGVIRSVCLTNRNNGMGIGFGTFDLSKISNKYNPNHWCYDNELINNEYYSGNENEYKSFYETFPYYGETRVFHSLDLDNDKYNEYSWEYWDEKDRDNNRVDIHNRIFYNEYSGLLFHKASSIFKSRPSSTFKKELLLDVKIKDLIAKIPKEILNGINSDVLKRINDIIYNGCIHFGIDENKNIHIFLFYSGWNTSNNKVLFHFVINNSEIEFINYKNNFSNNSGIFENHSITNNSVSFNNMNDYCNLFYYITNNKVYYTYGSTFYCVDLDNLEITSIKGNLSYPRIFDIDYQNHIIKIANDGDNLGLGKASRESRDITFYKIFYYNYIENKIKYTYMTPINNEVNGIYNLFTIHDNNNNLLNFFNTYNGSVNNKATRYGYLGFRTDYLATINNLPEPIEKTNDKTMKITYTLREV